ncbi:hypothetical protein H311_02025, partial [Anncaliia algerae PRA109]
MKFSKYKNILLNNINRENPKVSNPKRKRFDDKELQKHSNANKKNFIKQVKYVTHEKNASSDIVFKRSMDEKAVKRSLFILEGEEGFEDKSLRGKMTEVIKRSSKELQDSFYDLGIKGELMVDWDSFKHYIVEFCLRQDINSISKYNNETWSDYITRLNDWAKLRNYSEE